MSNVRNIEQYVGKIILNELKEQNQELQNLKGFLRKAVENRNQNAIYIRKCFACSNVDFFCGDETLAWTTDKMIWCERTVYKMPGCGPFCVDCAPKNLKLVEREGKQIWSCFYCDEEN